MNNRLSYSQLRLYSECGKKYKYYYKDRLREKVKGSALFFGTAIDKAVEAILKHKDVNDEEVFDKYWSRQDINGKDVYLPDSTLIVYSGSDFDIDLLSKEDIQWLTAKAKEFLPELLEGHTWEDVFEVCAASKKNRYHTPWPEAQNRFYNLCSWFSLRRKGHLMLEANRTKVMPKFKKILATQKEIALTNDEGDGLVGFADAIVEWEDGRTVILDYKTSSIKYTENSVLEGEQLSIYSESENIPTCGYIVFLKKVVKNKICSSCQYNGSAGTHRTCPNKVQGIRCNAKWNIIPEIALQIIISDIPQKVRETVLENIHQRNIAIHQEIFPENTDACMKPWGRCPYFDLCQRGVDTGELEKV